MKVTMKDIALKLGVSINAVSIALNDKIGISDELRLEILKTADQMGYIYKNKKYLSVFSKSNICVLMQRYYAEIGHFYSTIIDGIYLQAQALGYAVTEALFDNDYFQMPNCIMNRKVAGILIVGKISDSILNEIYSTGLPFVLIDYTSLLYPCDCVLTHNKQGGYIMTSFVVSKGYKKIGFFGDLDYSLNFEDRFLGYRQALLKHQIVSKENVLKYIEQYSFLRNIETYILSHDLQHIVALLKDHSLPDVFICANDLNAYYVIEALRCLGIKVPNDIGVVGFDDIELCKKSEPAITTMQIQKQLMGEIAVNHLIEKINRTKNIPLTRLLSVKIIERDSLK